LNLSYFSGGGPQNSNSIVELCYKHYLSEVCKEQAKDVSLLRQYYCGEQPTILTKNQQNYLNVATVNDNFVKDAVNLPAERINIESWVSENKEATLESEVIFSTNENGGFSQSELYISTLRDGDSYVLVQHIETAPASVTKGNESGVRWVVLPKAFYVDDVVYGCRLHRNEAGDIKFASRRWQNEDIYISDGKKSNQMLSLYFPDRIEHYTMASSNVRGRFANATWVEFRGIDDELPWPIPWVDTQGNQKPCRYHGV
jgi:hypothetical protein